MNATVAPVTPGTFYAALFVSGVLESSDPAERLTLAVDAVKELLPEGYAVEAPNGLLYVTRRDRWDEEIGVATLTIPQAVAACWECVRGGGFADACVDAQRDELVVPTFAEVDDAVRKERHAMGDLCADGCDACDGHRAAVERIEKREAA